MLQGLKRLQNKHVNVFCGLVTGAGERVAGCGASPSDQGYQEFSYNAGFGCLSTVNLCDACADAATRGFNILSVHRADAETVKVTVSIDAKRWNKAKRSGELGQLYGIDVSNAVYRGFGVKAYNPTVDANARAKQGRKIIIFYYADAVWNTRPVAPVIPMPKRDNAQAPIDADAMPCDVIRVDFRRKRRVAA